MVDIRKYKSTGDDEKAEGMRRGLRNLRTWTWTASSIGRELSSDRVKDRLSDFGKSQSYRHHKQPAVTRCYPTLSREQNPGSTLNYNLIAPQAGRTSRARQT